MNPQVCRFCESPTATDCPLRRMCEMHFRFYHMQAQSRQRGKTIPTRQELESLVAGLKDFACPHCGVRMVWRKKGPNAYDAISIQHNRDGGHCLICLRCNLRHARYADDSYYLTPSNLYPCAGCQKWLPRTSFRLRKGVRRADRCRPCMNAKRSAERRLSRARRRSTGQS